MSNRLDQLNSALPDLPEVFLTYQQRLWTGVDHNSLLAIEKSRRTGYSWALAAIAAGVASLAREAGGMDVLYMGYEKDMTREFMGYVGEFAKTYQMAASEIEEFDYVLQTPNQPDRSIGAFRIKFDSGFEVIALPSVARALRGKQGLVILDEAAFMDDLEEVLKAALALLMWGGKVIVCSTHNGELNPFNELIQDLRAHPAKGQVLRTTLDDAIADGLIQRIFMKLGREWSPAAGAEYVADLRLKYGDRADEELDCIPNPTSGVYLTRTLVEARSVAGIPVVRYDAPKGMATWPVSTREKEIADFCERELKPVLDALDPKEALAMGEDFGRIHDLTVLWFLGVAKDTTRHTRLVVELRGVPFEAQKQILFYICDRIKILRALKMDAGGNGAYLAEVALQKYGEQRVEEIRFTEQWYREQMPPLKSAFEEGGITVPMDDDIHTDLLSLKLIRGVARVADRVRVDETRTRHGDAAIAVALAYYASRAEPELYEYRGGLAHGDDGGDRRWRQRPDHGGDDRRQGSSMMPELGRGWL